RQDQRGASGPQPGAAGGAAAGHGADWVVEKRTSWPRSNWAMTRGIVSVPVMRAIPRIAQHPARQSPTVLAVLQQHLTIDHGHMDPFRRLAYPHRTVREIVHH